MSTTSKKNLSLAIQILLIMTVLYFLGNGLIISKTLYHSDHSMTLSLWSLFAFEPTELQKNIKITSNDPRQKLSVSISILSRRKIRIHIKETVHPKGSPTTIEFSYAPTIFSWMKLTSKKTRIPRIHPILLNDSNLKIGTYTPIKLVFNTPLKKERLEKYIKADFDFKLTPDYYRNNNEKYTDYSIWGKFRNHTTWNRILRVTVPPQITEHQKREPLRLSSDL